MRYLLVARRCLIVLLLALAWFWTIAGAAFSPLLPAGLAMVATLLCIAVPLWSWRLAGRKWRAAGLLLPLLAVATLLLAGTAADGPALGS